MSEDTEPFFYLSGRVIHKRPVSRKEGNRTITSVGFPVCTVSEYADAEAVLRIFNVSVG